MGRQSKISAFIAFVTIGAFAASLAILASGAVIFGPDLNHWAEWKGRVIGAAGTVAGLVSAYAGLRLASRR